VSEDLSVEKGTKRERTGSKKGEGERGESVGGEMKKKG